MKLEWGTYKHFPYERELALREAVAMVGPNVEFSENGAVATGTVDPANARLLTYFSAVDSDGQRTDTLQSRLEKSAFTSQRRQSTRYSVHGLHEYRGKFNPQVCRALVNILGVPAGGILLDPFCGSGTTLVEAAHRGVRAVGTDLNPLAVYIANAKLQALITPASDLSAALTRVIAREPCAVVGDTNDARRIYLESWFEAPIVQQIERLRLAIADEIPTHATFLFVVASNLLRDFSLQEPIDLRIRRRASANAIDTFASTFHKAAVEAIRKLESAQAVIGTSLTPGRAYLRDNRSISDEELPGKADAAITSPPYATALPYIDTQRLSLIWLNLLSPNQIGPVEASLTGSREVSTKLKRGAQDTLVANIAGLPKEQADFCERLQNALTGSDGFRRQAVPLLLYRYFDQMSQTFRAVAGQMKPNAPFALIVGHNHTILGGNRYDIDTPSHLASLAEGAGWTIGEVTPLQAYQRYGLHASNAVKAETLVVLRAPSPSR